MPPFPDSGFDRVASFYDPLARLFFGSAQLQAQQVLLSFIKEHAKVLVVGGGSGWLLEQMLLTRKSLEIVYIDASPNMIRLAQERTAHHIKRSSCTVDFRIGNEQAILPGEQFDIIFTPFVLDLFPAQRLTQLMARLENALREKGQWLFADFWPVQQPAPVWQRLLLKTMYVFFKAVSGVKATQLPDFRHHFGKLKLHEKFTADFYKGMIQAKVFSRSGV